MADPWAQDQYNRTVSLQNQMIRDDQQRMDRMQADAAERNRKTVRNYIILIAILVVVHLFLTVWAIAVSQKCNDRDGRTLGAITAYIFPEIYLLQYGFRKYVTKEKGYCIENEKTDTSTK